MDNNKKNLENTIIQVSSSDNVLKKKKYIPRNRMKKIKRKKNNKKKVIVNFSYKYIIFINFFSLIILRQLFGITIKVSTFYLALKKIHYFKKSKKFLLKTEHVLRLECITKDSNCSVYVCLRKKSSI